MALSKAYHGEISNAAFANLAVDRHFNAVEHARNVMDAAASLSNRVNNVVSRLMGPQGMLEEVVGERPTHGPGIFPSLHDVSEETGYAIRKANEALDRLEKELA